MSNQQPIQAAATAVLDLTRKWQKAAADAELEYLRRWPADVQYDGCEEEAYAEVLQATERIYKDCVLDLMNEIYGTLIDYVEL